MQHSGGPVKRRTKRHLKSKPLSSKASEPHAHINADPRVCAGKPNPYACQAKLKKSSPMEPNDVFRRTTSKPYRNTHTHVAHSAPDKLLVPNMTAAVTLLQFL